MFDFIQANPVKSVDAIKNYEDLTSFVMYRGTEMAEKAIANNDLVYMEALRADTVMVRDAAIELMNARYDYLTWYSFMMYNNGKSKLIALDHTGDMKAVVAQFGKLDGQAYYENSVKPIYGTVTETELRVYYAQALTSIDSLIEMMRTALGR